VKCGIVGQIPPDCRLGYDSMDLVRREAGFRLAIVPFPRQAATVLNPAEEVP